MAKRLPNNLMDEVSTISQSLFGQAQNPQIDNLPK